jgi:hypothetical protein
MMTAEMLAYERFKAGKRKYPGARFLSFRDNGRGWWVVKPLDATKVESVRKQQVRLEQQVLTQQLEAIRYR